MTKQRIPSPAPARRRRRGLRLLGLAALLAVAPGTGGTGGPGLAAACPACQCGDPFVLLVGGDVPAYRGFMRFGTTFRMADMRVGEPGRTEQQETEHRMQFLATVAPSTSCVVSMALPLVRRELLGANGGRVTATAPGDLELRSRLTLFRGGDRTNGMVGGVSGGLTAPTAPRQFDDTEKPLDLDVQPGLGAWTGNGGVWGSVSRGALSLSGSSVVRLAGTAWDHHSGAAWLNSLALRRRCGGAVALQVALDSRWAALDTYGGVEDPTSGGVALFASPALTLTRGGTWVLDLGAQLPVRQEAAPHHRDRFVLNCSLTLNR